MARCHQGSPVSTTDVLVRSSRGVTLCENLTAVVCVLVPFEKIGDLGQQLLKPLDLVFGEVRKLALERIVNRTRSSRPEELNACLGIDRHENAPPVHIIPLRGHDSRLLHCGDDAGDETLREPRAVGDFPDSR